MGFLEDFAEGFKLPFQAIGEVARDTVIKPVGEIFNNTTRDASTAIQSLGHDARDLGSNISHDAAGVAGNLLNPMTLFVVGGGVLLLVVLLK